MFDDKFLETSVNHVSVDVQRSGSLGRSNNVYIVTLSLIVTENSKMMFDLQTSVSL